MITAGDALLSFSFFCTSATSVGSSSRLRLASLFSGASMRGSGVAVSMLARISSSSLTRSTGPLIGAFDAGLLVGCSLAGNGVPTGVAADCFFLYASKEIFFFGVFDPVRALSTPSFPSAPFTAVLSPPFIFKGLLSLSV